MIYFINFDLLFDPMVDELIQGLVPDHDVHIIGPTSSHLYSGEFLTSKSTNLGCKSVIWPLTNTWTDTIPEIRVALDKAGTMDAAIVSENPVHQSAADMLGIQFIRGFDWIKQ